MVQVPAGTFIMGRDAATEDEAPQRNVYLDTFWIDRNEATNADFQAFCDSTRRLLPNNPMWDDNYFLENPDKPVLNITWRQARDYCEWQGKRLPTEAQWEKAARGTEGLLYPWGNEYSAERANITGNDAHRRTAPVGAFPLGASPYGVNDMAGNVWEWCLDWYGEFYYKNAPLKNPPGPEEKSAWRVVRGGAFSSPPDDVMTTNRSKNKPDQPLHHIGCRCVWSADMTPAESDK
jgi:formylglycine-generating enzyme required for sulfatase activity